MLAVRLAHALELFLIIEMGSRGRSPGRSSYERVPRWQVSWPWSQSRCRRTIPVMLQPGDVQAFIEHCKEVYGRTLTEDEASRCLNNLLDLYDLVYQPLPSEQLESSETPDHPPAAPERSPSI